MPQQTPITILKNWGSGNVISAHSQTQSIDYLISNRDYVRGGAEGALAPPEFGGSERRTERETDNLLLLAPPESKS